MGFSFKQLSSFIVLGLTAITAGVILRSGSTTAQPMDEAAIILPAATGPRVEKVANYSLETASPARSGQKNFTEQVAQEISKDIIARNESGPATIDGKKWLSVSRPETITEEAIRKALASFDLDEFRVPADSSRIARSKKNDRAAITLYLREFQHILANRFGTLNINVSEIQPTETLEQLIAAYDSALADFYALPVPDELVAEHLDEITLIGTQREIFARMKEYETDPLGAILAISTREKLDEEFAALSARIVRLMAQQDISL